MLDGAFTDLRLAFRGMKNAPSFTLAAVLVLGVGIGASTIAFSALKMTVLASPPFPEAERMVMVDQIRKFDAGERSARWPYPLLLAVESVNDRLIDPVAGFDDGTVTLTGMGPASQIGMEIVSPDYFEVVGLPLTMGRAFVPEEGEEDGPYRVVVVSHGFWQGHLGGELSALDRILQLDGEPFRIVGVAPRGFSGLSGDADLWLPMGSTALFRPGRRAQNFNHQIWVAGRLRPGATLAAAQEQMRAIAERLSGTWPSDRYRLSASSIPEVWMNARAQKSAKLLALGAAMVLLVACANLSSLLLTRARRRARDGAVRLALGASRWRLSRLYQVESLVLACLGGIVGVAMAVVGIRAIMAAWPESLLNGSGLGLRVIDPTAMAPDGAVLGFTFLVVLFTALLVGVAPVFRTSGRSFATYLKAGSRTTRSAGRETGLDTRAALVACQVAAALALVIGAGLVGESVRRLLAVDEGFRTEQLLTFDYSQPQSVPPAGVGTIAERLTIAAEFDDLLLQRLAALPGVEAATVGCGVLSGYCAVLGVISVDGRPLEDPPSIAVVTVHDQYFEVLGVPITRGRGFTSRDGFGAPPVVVLSQQAAEMYFPGEDPVGRSIAIEFAAPGRERAEIIGVASDVLYSSPDAKQTPVAYFSTRERRFANHALVRTRGRPDRAAGAIRAEINSLDPSVAMSGVASVDELISRSVGDRRMILGLLGIFTSVAVFLAAVGTWGVVAYSVADRRRELSLRMALGAEGRHILGLVTREAAATALVGVIVGLVGALVGSRVLDAFLWEVGARDPMTFLTGALLVLGVVLVASYLPARRATRLDPAHALKVE